MRIGVLGCGQWGRNHARTLARLGVLGGVADLDRERAEAVAGLNGTAVLPVDRLLRDPGIDGLVIALPPAFHAQHALRAIAEGKHVLIEKPMALDPDDAAEIVARAAARGLVAMTGHVLRFHPAFEALEALVDEGRLGRIRHIETVRIGLGRQHPGSDAVLDLLPHDLSLILALADRQPGAGAILRGELANPGEDEPARLRLAFRGGLTSASRVSNTSPLRERHLTVRGEGGLLVFDDTQPWDRKLAFLGTGATVDSEPDRIAVPEREPLEAELRHFMDGIGGAPVTRSSGAEGLRVLRVIAGSAGRQAARPTPRVEAEPAREIPWR